MFFSLEDMCTDVYSLASPVILPCGREKTNGIIVLGDAPSEFDGEPTVAEEEKTSAEEENTVVSAVSSPLPMIMPKPPPRSKKP